jgi:hypothetical protein
MTSNAFGYPGTTPAISANGTNDAILWALEDADPVILHAYDAADITKELYNSGQALDNRDNAGAGVKWIPPTIADGKVFVPTGAGVGVFGLLGVNGKPCQRRPLEIRNWNLEIANPISNFQC